MSDQDRLDRLEQRLLRLEQLMRQVLQTLPGPLEGGAVPPPPPPPPPPLVQPVAERPATSEPAAVEPPTLKPAPRPAFDGEQWFGQRGLLAVGVLAVVLAAGYLLKLSFDRGWISPLVRCVGGAIAGGAVALLGWNMVRRGYRSYGLALVGTGAGIVYLTLWAASRLYGFLPPAIGVGGMALVALGLAMAAWQLEAEPLATVAAAGAFMAPLVIGNVDADADRLLGYLAAIGLTMGALAWENGWRVTALVIGLSFFGIGVPTAEHAQPLIVLAYGASGGAAGLALGLKRNWWETRFLSFWGGWGCLAFVGDRGYAPWVLLAGAALSWPVWAHAFTRDTTWPFSAPTKEPRPILQSLYFYVTPFWLVWAVSRLRWSALDAHEGLAAALVAAAYLAVGVTGERRPFALVGTLTALAAAFAEWNGDLTTAGVLGLLALAWGATGRVTRRTDWNLHALMAVVLALFTLWVGATGIRGSAGPAFTDRWALVLWGLIAVTVALATDLAAPEEEKEIPRRGILWALAGFTLWIGVTGELMRFFRLHVTDFQTAALAGGLSVSVWWLLLAGTCVAVGFQRGLRALRLAGLWVSGLAVLKVLLVDLSTLDALYRIGSVFVLGLVSLLVAWIYHRRAKLDAVTDR
ncbi:MAG: DUF2339 domain-containing protein [Gemmatimonadetes bacterium]|nr:DUF2339 domain-containing protein [Gemmatimonadota bacterium]